MHAAKIWRSWAIWAASSSSFSLASIRATTSGGRLGAVLKEPRTPSLVVVVGAALALAVAVASIAVCVRVRVLCGRRGGMMSE